MSKEPEIISQNSSQSVIKLHEHQYGQKLLDLSFLDIDEGTLEFKYVLQDGTLSIRDSMSDSEVQNAMSPVALRAMVKFSSFRDRKPGTLGLSSAYAIKVDGQEEQEEY